MGYIKIDSIFAAAIFVYSVALQDFISLSLSLSLSLSQLLDSRSSKVGKVYQLFLVKFVQVQSAYTYRQNRLSVVKLDNTFEVHKIERLRQLEILPPSPPSQ